MAEAGRLDTGEFSSVVSGYVTEETRSARACRAGMALVITDVTDDEGATPFSISSNVTRRQCE